MFARYAACLGGIARAFQRAHSSLPPGLPRAPELARIASAEDTAAARAWAAAFERADIPRAAVSLSFSRSSGPGGQNVNKVNTKATAVCDLSGAWIPPWARAALSKHPSYSVAAGGLLITSTLTRSQPKNVSDCLAKAAVADIKNETPPEVSARVNEYIRQQDRRRLFGKNLRGQTKALRKRPDCD